jgi:hypothetical protein
MLDLLNRMANVHATRQLEDFEQETEALRQQRQTEG